MAAIAIQIWLTFLLGILKDILWQFVINSPKARRAYLWIKRKYILARLPFPVFVKHYKSFIREKNEIFEIMMAGLEKKLTGNHIFFFSALSKYWLLKKTLIQQYEKVLSIYLIDDDYDVFEDELKRSKVTKTKVSLNKFIWRLKKIDPEFKELFEKCEQNMLRLKQIIGTALSIGETRMKSNFDPNSLSEEKLTEIIRNYTLDQNSFLSKWKSSNNKIRDIDKFELYTDTKLTQKYVNKLNISMGEKDYENLLPIIKELDEIWTTLISKIPHKHLKFKKKFIRSERVYAKVYYGLLIKKYVNVENKKPLKELSYSDAALIIERSCNYKKEKEELLSRLNIREISEEEKWKIACRLWEIDEIRKNICKVYLNIDGDTSNWVTNYEKLTSLASKSDHTSLNKDMYTNAEVFLKEKISPASVFLNVRNYPALSPNQPN